MLGALGQGRKCCSYDSEVSDDTPQRNGDAQKVHVFAVSDLVTAAAFRAERDLRTAVVQVGQVDGQDESYGAENGYCKIKALSLKRPELSPAGGGSFSGFPSSHLDASSLIV